jgi:hypothetical protein
MKFRIVSNNKYNLAALIRKYLYTQIFTCIPKKVTILKNTSEISDSEISQRLSLIYFTQPGVYNLYVKDSKNISTKDIKDVVTTSPVYTNLVLHQDKEFTLDVKMEIEKGKYSDSCKHSSIIKFKYLKDLENFLEIEYLDSISSKEENNLKFIITKISQELENLKTEIAKWTKA